MKTQDPDENDNAIKIPLDSFFQGVNRLFVLAFDSTDGNGVKKDDYKKHLLPRVRLTEYNVLIDGRNSYDQPISDEIRQYNEVRKIATGKGDNYATGCLLDYKYFKENYQLIAVDLSKQKELDADLRAIQQIEFYGKLTSKAQVLTVLEKSKEAILQFYKGTAKIL